jgi:Xaa-Pro dipeptidase
MGDHTHKIPMSLFKDNRSKVIDELRKDERLAGKKAMLLLQGGDNISFYDTDVDYVFRQVKSILFVVNVYVGTITNSNGL